jgi:hypothetical protein
MGGRPAQPPLRAHADVLSHSTHTFCVPRSCTPPLRPPLPPPPPAPPRPASPSRARARATRPPPPLPRRRPPHRCLPTAPRFRHQPTGQPPRTVSPTVARVCPTVRVRRPLHGALRACPLPWAVRLPRLPQPPSRQPPPYRVRTRPRYPRHGRNRCRVRPRRLRGCRATY